MSLEGMCKQASWPNKDTSSSRPTAARHPPCGLDMQTHMQTRKTAATCGQATNKFNTPDAPQATADSDRHLQIISSTDSIRQF